MKRAACILSVMQAVTAIISAFGLTIWDLAENHGEFTRVAVAVVRHLAHTVGLG